MTIETIRARRVGFGGTWEIETEATVTVKDGAKVYVQGSSGGEYTVSSASVFDWLANGGNDPGVRPDEEYDGPDEGSEYYEVFKTLSLVLRMMDDMDEDREVEITFRE